MQLSNPHQTLHALINFFRVITHFVVENDLDAFDVRDLRGRIAFHDHQVGLFAE